MNSLEYKIIWELETWKKVTFLNNNYYCSPFLDILYLGKGGEQHESYSRSQ